jgi:flagellar hook-length control protein FliK
MDVMPMAAMPVTVDRIAPTMPVTGGAAPNGAASGFGAALSAAQGEGLTNAAGRVPPGLGQGAANAEAPETEGQGGPEAADALETSLAGALGLAGVVVARPQLAGLTSLAARGLGGQGARPTGLQLQSLAVATLNPLMPAAVRGLQGRVAAEGFADLQASLQGPAVAPGEGGDVGDILTALQTGQRQSTLTQELAHLLSQRHGPLPEFGASAESSAQADASTQTPDPVAEATTRPAASAQPFIAPLVVAAPRSGEPDRVAADAGPAMTADDALAAAAETERPVTHAGVAEGLGANANGEHGAHSLGAAGSLTPTANGPAPVTAAPPTPVHAQTVIPGLPPGVDAPAVLRQVGDGLKLMTVGSRQSAEIQLSPAELGKVKIRMEIEGKSVRMFVTTENAGVRDLVAQGLDGLRRDLMAQGLQCSHMSVDVQADGRGFARDRRGESDERDDALRESPEESLEFSTRSPPSTRRSRSDGKRIDLTV